MRDPTELKQQLWSALGLASTASKDDARRAFDRVIADFADGPPDPRQRLATLVEKLVQTRGLGFHAALNEAKRTRPDLVAEVVQYYATER